MISLRNWLQGWERRGKKPGRKYAINFFWIFTIMGNFKQSTNVRSWFLSMDRYWIEIKNGENNQDNKIGCTRCSQNLSFGGAQGGKTNIIGKRQQIFADSMRSLGPSYELWPPLWDSKSFIRCIISHSGVSFLKYLGFQIMMWCFVARGFPRKQISSKTRAPAWPKARSLCRRRSGKPHPSRRRGRRVAPTAPRFAANQDGVGWG